MGYWCTLHLFDDRKFYREVVPELKGEIGDLHSACLDFLKSHVIGGISRLSHRETNQLVDQTIERITSISKSLDDSFKIHTEFQEIKDYDSQMSFLNNLNGYYEFCKFFEYYLFKTCADFLPHLLLGKGGIARNFDLKTKTLSYNIITKLDDWKLFLCGHGTGITNWLTNQDIDLLYHDKENLHFDNNERAISFLELLDIAYKNKLSFIMGVDMSVGRLELLPSHKLASNVY